MAILELGNGQDGGPTSKREGGVAGTGPPPAILNLRSYDLRSYHSTQAASETCGVVSVFGFGSTIYVVQASLEIWEFVKPPALDFRVPRLQTSSPARLRDLS